MTLRATSSSVDEVPLWARLLLWTLIALTGFGVLAFTAAATACDYRPDPIDVPPTVVVLP